MPFYDYKCSNPECNHIIKDVEEKPSDDKFPHICPKCEEFAMHRMIVHELCQYLPIREFGFGWVAIEEFETEAEANTAKQSKEKPGDYMVREKRQPLKQSSAPRVIFKDLPKGHNLSATQRRELFNSTDPKDFKKIM